MKKKASLLSYRVVVREAVHQQDRFLDLVSVQESGHLCIHLGGLPDRPLLGLEAARGQGAVVRSRTGDAASEEVAGVRQEVGCGEGPVRVAPDGDLGGVGDAEADDLGDGGLGGGDELLDVAVRRGGGWCAYVG